MEFCFIKLAVEIRLLYLKKNISPWNILSILMDKIPQKNDFNTAQVFCISKGFHSKLINSILGLLTLLN